MRKIFFILFLVAIFFFPRSEAFAQAACTDFYECTPGDKPIITGVGVLRCTPPGTTSLNPPGKVAACAAGTTADAKCNCVAAGAAGGVAPSSTPCTDPKICSSGQGTRCDLTTGQPIAIGTGTADPNSGIYTAIGCVPTKPQILVEALVRYGTMAAGGIAFLLMILGAIQMITAEGNPESIKQAQERFYSAIIGLLLIIFSVLLMQVIGVDVLDLPGFAP